MENIVCARLSQSQKIVVYFEHYV